MILQLFYFIFLLFSTIQISSYLFFISSNLLIILCNTRQFIIHSIYNYTLYFYTHSQFYVIGCTIKRNQESKSRLNNYCKLTKKSTFSPTLFNNQFLLILALVSIFQDLPIRNDYFTGSLLIILFVFNPLPHLLNITVSFAQTSLIWLIFYQFGFDYVSRILSQISFMHNELQYSRLYILINKQIQNQVCVYYSIRMALNHLQKCYDMVQIMRDSQFDFKYSYYIEYDTRILNFINLQLQFIQNKKLNLFKFIIFFFCSNKNIQALAMERFLFQYFFENLTQVYFMYSKSSKFQLVNSSFFVQVAVCLQVQYKNFGYQCFLIFEDNELMDNQIFFFLKFLLQKSNNFSNRVLN